MSPHYAEKSKCNKESENIFLLFQDFKFLSDFLSPALTPIRFPSSVLRGSEHRLPVLLLQTRYPPQHAGSSMKIRLFLDCF
ncbi:hypothetical protein V6Z11_D08G097900 [Gossypium hirsutum]